MNDLKVGVACNTQKIDLPQDNRQGAVGLFPIPAGRSLS